MNSPSDVLVLRDIGKSFKNNVAIKAVDLLLRRGECLGVLGPNGAGKTTLLRIALGLTAADRGEVQLLGHRVPDFGHLARARVGVVPQVDALDPDFSVSENLRVFGRYFDISGQLLNERIPSLLEFASLDKRADEKIAKLSGGLKRRLTLVRAMINAPEMIFLDEPTTALDPQARHMIWDRLQSLRENGTTLLLTTHFMDEAQRLCDRIVVIDGGRVIVEGAPRELIRRYIGSDVLELFGRLAHVWLQSHPQLREKARVERSGETYFIYEADVRLWLARLESTQEAVRPEYLYRPANLEDVFLRLTG